jgi:hypothetical protein
MKMDDVLNERNADPVKLAQRTAKRYGTEKNYGYDNSETVPGKYIPLKNYDDDLVDEMEFAVNEMYKKLGWTPGTRNIPEIRKEMEKVAGSNEHIEIRKLYATQPFVRIEDEEVLKQKVDSNKTISVLKYQNRYFIRDGHHATLAATLRGERMINANILDLDLLYKKYKISASEMAIIEGGHTLEETTNKNKLFDFDKY